MEYHLINTSFKFKKPILACGADMKAGFCLTKDKTAHLFIVGGDLGNVESFNTYRRQIHKAIRRLKIHPEVIVYDLHPEYFSTKFAQDYHLSSTIHHPIQHHHAHIVSCMADNELNEKVIGVALDGTGLGDDGRLWGGEFLLCDYRGYKRAGHLEYVPLIGGDMAIREPWRLACAWLHYVYGEDFLRLKIDLVKRLNKNTWQILNSMLNNKINLSFSSSIGRLFDGVASLIGLRDKVDYEAQAALELEGLARDASSYQLSAISYQPRAFRPYRFQVYNHKGHFIIGPASMFKNIVRDLQKKVSASQIALRFHMTVVQMASEVCNNIRHKTGIKKVVLSGGVFQNKILSSQVESILKIGGFVVFQNKNLTPNDGSIALGQALIANAKAHI